MDGVSSRPDNHEPGRNAKTPGPGPGVFTVRPGMAPGMGLQPFLGAASFFLLQSAQSLQEAALFFSQQALPQPFLGSAFFSSAAKPARSKELTRASASIFFMKVSDIGGHGPTGSTLASPGAFPKHFIWSMAEQVL